MLQKVMESIHSGEYKATHKEVPAFVSLDHVFDEEKSVKWNREQAMAQREAHNKITQENREMERKMAFRFEQDLCAALMADYGFTNKQAHLIYDKAYSKKHNYGYAEIASCAEDIADFLVGFKDAK